MTKLENAKLVSLTMNKTNREGYYGFTLTAVYKYEDEQGEWEATFKDIPLPITTDTLPEVSVRSHEEFIDDTFIPATYVNLGYGDQAVYHVFCEGKLIKEKVHDMTIDEIEKKLGYKVRIVKERKENKNA